MQTERKPNLIALRNTLIEGMSRIIADHVHAEPYERQTLIDLAKIAGFDLASDRYDDARTILCDARDGIPSPRMACEAAAQRIRG